MKWSGQAQSASPCGVNKQRPLQPPLFSQGLGVTKNVKNQIRITLELEEITSRLKYNEILNYSALFYHCPFRIVFVPTYNKLIIIAAGGILRE